MKIHCLFLQFIFIVLFAGCSKTKINPDKSYLDLPAYSQNGSNVGGVLINDTAWLTIDLPILNFYPAFPINLECFPSGDSIVLSLYGHFKDSSVSLRLPYSIFIILKGIRIQKDSDLLNLTSKSFILDGINNYGGFGNIFVDKIGKGSGQIKFGKVALVNNIAVGDGSPGNPIHHPFIFPAQFEFNFFQDRIYTLSQGRFDMGILNGTNLFIN